MSDSTAPGTHAHDRRGHHAGHDHAHLGHDHHAMPAPEAGMVSDPVCGMTVDPHTAKHRAEHAGRPYYFCSNGCQTKFEADPGRYLDPGQAAGAAPVPEGTIYTCPMHPEVRQVGPGSCPICGMALEPVLVGADEGPRSRTHNGWHG